MDCSPPGSSVHGILQARILEWVAILFSRDLPDLEIKPGSPALQEDSLHSEPPAKPFQHLCGSWNMVKNLPANAGGISDAGSIPASGRSPGVENGNPLQYSCLENSMDRGAWWAAVYRVVKNQTRLSTHIDYRI